MISEVEIRPSCLLEEDSTVDSLELSRMEPIMKSVQQKITGFNSTTSVCFYYSTSCVVYFEGEF